MEQLHTFKKIISICCLSISLDTNKPHLFQIKFQQVSPHSLFKYQITKSRDEVMRLFERLEADIFDFDNPFSQRFFSNLTKVNTPLIATLNSTLQDCTSRLDILVHHHFLDFFSIHKHYPDFITCLKEEMLALDLSKANVGKIQQLEKGKGGKQTANFESMINILRLEESDRLDLEGRCIIDFTFMVYHGSQFLILLDQQKKGKISTIFHTFFQDQKPSGSLALFRQQGDHFIRRSNTSLQAEPLSMEHNRRTSMITTLTAVGVYIHLLKLQQKDESIQLFAFVPLIGVSAITNNCIVGEVYLVRRVDPYKLYVYGIKEEQLHPMEYKYKNASSICFEQTNHRLFVGDQTGIYIYLAKGGLDIKRLHFLPTDQSFISITQKFGYLYCVNAGGTLTVIELKPPQKEQLMSVTTTISIPPNTRKVIGSKSKRMIVSCFGQCVVLIDTLEGPINSFRLKGHQSIRAMVYDEQGQRLLAMTEQGAVVSLLINKAFQ